MNNNTVIDVSALCKTFNNKLVVNNLSLTVKKGEVYGFLGPNGSGKTTTIRMLCGLLTADSGKGKCLGYDIFKDRDKIKKSVGYMTQYFSFYKDLSVEENLKFIARIYGVSSINNKVQQIMQENDLLQFKNQLTGRLSGGWQQRVALAACLLHNPALLLLDEPTAGIDPIARRIFWDKIHALSEQGITTLMSTHYMDEAERCTRLAYIAYGDLLIEGSVDEVIAATKIITWNVYGDVTTNLLQKIKKLPGVKQASLFGREIHVCGYDKDLIAFGLKTLSKDYKINYVLINSTLEDAFISLVSKDLFSTQ